MIENRSATKSVNEALKNLAKHADLNCITQSLADSARAEAIKLDERADHNNPLRGMPFVVKANIAVKGALQDGGSPSLKDNIADQDATIVAKLRAAGAIPVAMANMHELAFGITSHNSFYGPVKNPHNPDHMSGGSSGGTAAAIGCGAVPAGVASDTGGSGRLPAAFCGCVGFRPTQDRFPKTGILTLSHTLDTQSVMGMDIRTVAALDAAITDETELPQLTTIRLGVLNNPFWSGLSSQMTDLGRRVLAQLEAGGVNIVTNDEPQIEVLTEAAGFPIALNETMTNWQKFAKDLCGLSLAEFSQTIASADVRDLYEMMARGDVPPADAYADAIQNARPKLQSLFDNLFASMGIDAFIFPTLARTAPLIDATEMIDIDGEILPLFATLTRRELSASVAGLPALSLPGGADANGLPFGMELVGPAGSDRQLLSLALNIEDLLRS